MTSRATRKLLELLRLAHPKDLILSVVLAAIVVLESLEGPVALWAFGAPTALLLGWRRRAPLVVAGMISAALILGEVLAPADLEDSVLGFVAVILIAIYSVAAYERSLPKALAGGALVTGELRPSFRRVKRRRLLAVPLHVHGGCMARGTCSPWSGAGSRQAGATTGGSDQSRNRRGKNPAGPGAT